MEIRCKEKSDHYILLYFQMRKRFTKVSFTALIKTNYKYIHNGRYSHFVPIPTLRTDNVGIVLRKVRIPTLPGKVRILTLRKTIPELYRFLLKHIGFEIYWRE